MQKYFIFFLLTLLPVVGFSKDFVNVAIRVNIDQNVILGVYEKGGEQKLFNFQLKDADYNDGHTIVIYKKWMPEIPEGYGLRMHISYPDEFMVVTESNRSVKTNTGVRYEFDNPKDGVVLALSDKWMKETTTHDGVDISTYFTEKNRRYTAAYFERIKGLLDVYIKKLGGYPYSSFNVIDVPFPAGHALTSLTFISSGIIGMPFLTEVSLGHELVHQWVGVGVVADYESGNWAEGLTTYLADRYYAEVKGEGAEYRKNALESYMANARQKEDGTCLMEFKYNKDRSAQAIGYGKGMMVFSMLESMLGKTDFDKGIKVFISRYMHKKASWDDLITIMEDISGIYLKGFMDGWLTETALADFDINGVNASGGLTGYSVSFNVKNKYEWLEYPLEVTVETEDGKVKDYLYIKEKGKDVTIKTESKPLRLIIDPEYKTARYLKDAEMSPVLYHLFSKYEKTVFVNPDQRDIYAPLIMSLKDAEVVSDEESPYVHTDQILVFLGENNRAYKKLYGKDLEPFSGDFMVKGVLHPMGSDRMSYVMISKDMAASEQNAHRIGHYGKYSSLVQDGGREYTKTIDKAEQGVVISLDHKKQGVAVQQPLSIKEIVGMNSDKKVILIGENHTDYAHHENQYEVVRELINSGKDVAIGLEMFQRPFQKYLDAYIAGEISEREMLEKTEYFDRWRYDYRLYKRLIDYAKSKHIPLIALNLEQEITKKVSAEGILSLSDEDLAKIPSDIQYTGGAYKDFLKTVFQMHEGDRVFEHFYESQLLWDETMAETAYKYMESHPEKTMVIVAGNGHIRFGHGIADRLKRRNGLANTVIVQDEDYESGIADYILYPEKMEFEESPKLGVMVDEDDKGLLVKTVTKGSLAEKSGVHDGDYIINFNGQKVHNLTGVRIGLLSAEKGKTYNMTVTRDGKDVSFSVTF